MNGGAQEEQYFYFEGEPTDAEVDWFARKMGMHLVRDKDFLYLAREGLMNPPPDGWETVKSQTGSIHWVNSDHTELMDDPPHLAELTENFKKVKKKAQMLANRGEDEKMNARKKLLGRNLPDSMLNNDSNPPPNPRGGGYDEKSLKKSGPGTSDLMKEMKGNPTANNRGGLNATPNQKGQTDLFNGRESTDPRAKQARLEESEGEAFSIGEAYDDDVPYNYTKSTVKKRGETGSTPKSHATGADPKRAGASGAILYRDEEEGSPLDEFITPSGKKEPPRANRGGQAAQPNYSQMGQQSQMIDSAVLEKMIQEINTMQMRVSEIEQQNANLKKQNQELVKGQRSLQVQTNKEIQAARRELEETIKEKEDQISKTLKGELEKKLDEDKSKFTLLQEMKDIKAIFQKSLVMRADNTPNLSAGTDLQKALPLADSVVIPNGQVPSQNMFHQSFGAEAAPEAVTEAVKPSSQYLGQGQQPSQVAPQTAPEAVPIQQKAPPVVQSPPVVGAPPVVVNTHPKLSPAVISSYEGKWLGILLKEKGLLAKVTASITQLAKRIKQRKKHLLKHESDMNLEVSRLSLTPEHPLVLRIRDFLKMQNKDLKKDKNSLRREEDNYRRRAEGIATLEQFLTFAQGTGSFTPEIDKQLEEVYFRFKDTPLSGLNASFMEDDEESSLHSERRITQQGSSMTLEAGENLDPKPEDKPKSEEKPAEDSTPEGAQVPVVVTEGQNPPVLRTRKSSHQSKGSPTLKGTYFNEIGGRRAAKSIDKWPDVSRDHKLFSKTTDFLNEQWYQSKMRDSLAYRPSALRWEDFTNSSSTYMKRYFQTQSRWYTDIRREVCLLLSRSKSSSGELCLPVECTNR